ncbi:MAG TPA: hypothetical protein VM287_15730 [Egibacteraceae bacterium]|nr:hypothetical protein [Egibacteraceae bacterium]
MRRWPLIGAAAAAGASLVVLASSGFLDRSPDRDPVAPATEPPAGSRTSAMAAPVHAQSSDRTEDGAQTAAIAFASASQDWLYLPDGQVDRAVRSIATTSAGPSLSRETIEEIRSARDALAKSPGRVWWLVRPLASRVERFDPPSARVVVWTVTVLSAADVALPQADWVRVAVDLQWERESWRVQAVNDVPGPTPMTGTKDRPWQPEPFDDALRGFERVGSEPRP